MYCANVLVHYVFFFLKPLLGHQNFTRAIHIVSPWDRRLYIPSEGCGAVAPTHLELSGLNIHTYATN